MADKRLRNFARILVHYSLKAKKNQVVGIHCTPLAEPLVSEVYAELLKTGCHPVLRMMPDSCQEIFYTHGQKQHFGSINRFEKAYADAVDARLIIKSESNTRALAGIDPRSVSRYMRTMHPVIMKLSRKRWTITLFPTLAYAQDADMSLGEFEDFVYHAVGADCADPVAKWGKVHKYQGALVERLNRADKVRIIGDETDLTLSVKGKKFINSDGRANMPSGEVFTDPVVDSAEGYIKYDYPVCNQGREISGIRLVFRKGYVVEASADKNQDFLMAMLDTDKGSRRLGELGIGTNRDIDRFIKNILFDEKIHGTIHLAIGRGGVNRSAVHWDMIKDLRRGGAVYLDGRIFQKDGKFIS